MTTTLAPTRPLTAQLSETDGWDYERQTAFVDATSALGPWVRVLDADNGLGTDTMRWSQDVRSDPYVVCISDRSGRFPTIALDFDAKLGRPGAAAEHAEQVAGLLAKAGIRTVVAASGPTGGRHVMFKVSGRGLDPQSARRLVQRLIAAGFTTLDPSCMSSKLELIRPIGSPHRVTGRSQVIGDEVIAIATLRGEGASSAATVRALVDALRGPGEQRLALKPPGRASLTLPISGDYASGSEELQAYATAVANRGGGTSELKDALSALPDDHRVLRHLRRHRSADDPDRTLRRSMTKADEFVRKHPKISGRSRPDSEVLADWQARTFDLARGALGKVLPVLLALAVEHDRALVGISTRDLAERAGVSEATARRAVTTAVDLGVVQVADAGSAGRARRLRLLPSAGWDMAVRDAVGTSVGLGGVSLPTASTTADSALALAQNTGAEIWDRQGLGDHRRKTYLVLAHRAREETATTVGTIASAVGKSTRSVRDDLARLEVIGLVRRLGTRTWVAEWRDPAEVAVELGVAAVPGERKRKHAAERRRHNLRIVSARFGGLGGGSA